MWQKIQEIWAGLPLFLQVPVALLLGYWMFRSICMWILANPTEANDEQEKEELTLSAGIILLPVGIIYGIMYLIIVPLKWAGRHWFGLDDEITSDDFMP